MAEPDLQEGIEYWNGQPASLDGVLGGFGSGSLPRIDAFGSRQFLLYLLPELCTVPSAIRPLVPPPDADRRIRALDVGAGIGRVTSDVLLHLVSDVVLLEPVKQFVHEALALGQASADDNAPAPWPRWKGIADRSKSVTFLQGTLQYFDPAAPLQHTTRIGRVGYIPPEGDTDTDTDTDVDSDINSGFDVIWCQWCLGHLRDADLVAFFRRCKGAVRTPRSLIIVKENLCTDQDDGRARSEFDEQDSSLTRSDTAWKNIFFDAGLKLIRESIQLGFPKGLYDVKM